MYIEMYLPHVFEQLLFVCELFLMQIKGYEPDI